MSTRFKNPDAGSHPADDGETIAALVKMLSGMGIDRARIDAMISKSARPAAEPRPVYKGETANDANAKASARRSA